MIQLKCVGWCNNTNEVTHIGSKGYTYCAKCAVERRQSGYERTRKMTPTELKLLLSGKRIAKY